MDKIEYTVAKKKWNFENGCGNHRIIVSSPKGRYVSVLLPWRRHDPLCDTVGVKIFYTPKGMRKKGGIGAKEIKDVFIKKSDSESGEIVFRAPEKGLYEVYYMPFRMLREWYDPATIYFTKDEMKPGKAWLASLSETMPMAKALRYEARTEFDSFYPMEIPMTREEEKAFCREGKDFFSFPVSRLTPIRMKDRFPLVFSETYTENKCVLSDNVSDNEHYAFQICTYAKKNLKNVKIRFYDDRNKEYSKEDVICFNTDGYDTLGKEIKIERDAEKGKILTYWCGVRCENFKKSEIKIRVCTAADNSKETRLSDIILYKDGTFLERNGDDDLWRHSRLFWLNSRIGISQRSPKPYTPVKYDGKKKEVSILGRSFTLSESGLPKSIKSSFDEFVKLKKGTKETELLLGGITFSTNDKNLEWSGLKAVSQSESEAVFSARAKDGDVTLVSGISYEFDGNIDCSIYVSSPVKTERNITLTLPLVRKNVPLMAGMLHEGGKAPLKWDYRFDPAYNGYLVWLGKVNAGIQLKLMSEKEDWGFFKKLPETWSNNLHGRLSLETDEEAGEVLISAETGKMKLEPGRKYRFHFHLTVTPFHEINYVSHFTEHYYHKNSWHSTEPVPCLENAVKNNCRTVILHQGGPLNENINYPFILADKLKEHIDKAHDMGLKYKIYYTIRELSNYTSELWALRTLGDEVFITDHSHSIADFFKKDKDEVRPERVTPWLVEHLTDGFGMAWNQFLQSGEYDSAVATKTSSRWNNYYLEGLDWLCKVVGVDGLYLDGIGYDRHIMRRAYNILMTNRGECDIDIHNGNEHCNIAYGYGSSICSYLEHFAYAKAIWNGEGYDYNSADPDYWMSEISGLPFGIMSEMLQSGGNPFRGMIYGMTARCGWSQGGVSTPLFKLWDEFGIKDAVMYGYWNKDCPVHTENENVKATAYLKKNGDCLIVLADWYMHPWKNILINLDEEMLKIKGDYELYAPAIEDVQDEAVYRKGELIRIEPLKGKILILRRK